MKANEESVIDWDQVGLIFFKSAYSFVAVILLLTSFYCDTYSIEKLIMSYKAIGYSLAWCCAFWAITKMFVLDIKAPTAIEFTISFTPLLVASIYLLYNITSN
tara:strand:+ start:366 stop:674 length:309 start_codon:yes stop_codon:yes gene_type:complete